MGAKDLEAASNALIKQSVKYHVNHVLYLYTYTYYEANIVGPEAVRATARK